MSSGKFLSAQISNDSEVTISRAEFLRIFDAIKADQDLVTDLADYKLRWTNVENSGGDLAFAELPRSMSTVVRIMRQVVGNPQVAILSADVVLHYLELRRGDQDHGQ